MAGKAYVGVNNVAHRVKKIYVGVNNVARKVKKVYVGVNGLARLCFSNGDLRRYANELNASFYEGAATSNYMVLITGTTATAYNRSLTATILAAPTSRLENSVGAASTGEYNLFAGGFGTTPAGYDRSLDAVDCYDGSLTKVTMPTISKMSHYAGVSVGDYALFGGGYNRENSSDASKAVYAYDSSLTRTLFGSGSASGLAQGAARSGTSWNDNYALFLGGRMYPSQSYMANFLSAYCTAYDASLTKTSVTLPYGCAAKKHSKAGKYALYAPGTKTASSSGTGSIADDQTVFAFDDTMTMQTLSSGTDPGISDGMASAGEYGFIYSHSSSAYGINVYDGKLVRTTPFTASGTKQTGVCFGEDLAIVGGESGAADVFRMIDD